MQDPIAVELQAHVGRNLRVQVGKQSYIGKITSVTDEIVEMTSGSDPVEITLRTDVIDAVMVYSQAKEDEEWI